MSDEMSAAMHDAPDDPIAAQFIPDARELTIAASELADPIGDAPHSPLPSLVHRYPNRVLWKISPVCAVYCRFCFRKEHIGRRGQALRQSEITAGAAYLAANPHIEEIILSGGDPLTLSNKKLRQNLAIIREYGLPFTVMFDGNKAAAQAFGTQVYPTSFLINKKGEILKTFVGEPDFAALYQEIDKELAK